MRRRFFQNAKKEIAGPSCPCKKIIAASEIDGGFW
jgi:hypothetical protein